MAINALLSTVLPDMLLALAVVMTSPLLATLGRALILTLTLTRTRTRTRTLTLTLTLTPNPNPNQASPP